MKCGTYSGYKKHRKDKSFICQPCRLAMNAYRREYNKRKPEKNAQYHAKYKAKFAPAKEAERAAKKAARDIASAEKAQKLAVARAERAALKEARRIEREAELAKIKANKAKVSAAQMRDVLRYIRYQRLLINSQLKKHARQEAINAQKEQARLAKEVAVAEEQLRRQQREQHRQLMLNQHGTSIGDYSRCKKANTTACADCLKAASAYRKAQVARDPEKFKQQKKKYLKANPNRRHHSNRDRARKKGVPSQYYTRQQIFNRDGYDCYLCNLPVDLTANHVQGQPGWELYPHVEHVIPLALGGHDTLDNVKIAHAICNIRKGVSAPVAV